MKEIPSGGDKPKGSKPKLLNKDTITLTREEVREAREHINDCMGWLDYEGDCKETYMLEVKDSPLCHLCKRLTEFASQGDPVGKGEEDE